MKEDDIISRVSSITEEVEILREELEDSFHIPRCDVYTLSKVTRAIDELTCVYQMLTNRLDEREDVDTEDWEDE